MILECTKCSARFLLADHLMPPEGRTVRCGACGNQWLATGAAPGAPSAADALLAELEKPRAAAEEVVQVEIDGDGIAPTRMRQVKPKIPAKKPKNRAASFKIAAPAMAILWAVLAFVTYFPRGMEMPVLGGLYASAGVTTTEGLVFDNIHLDQEKEEERTRYIITGSVVNHAATERTIPIVSVVLKNEEGKALWNREYPVNEVVKPGAAYPFRIDNVQTSFAGDVKAIVVDLGNTLQLRMR